MTSPDRDREETPKRPAPRRVRKFHEGIKRPPIRITEEDVERAIRDAENCRRLVENGKDPFEIFKLLLRLTAPDGD
ncbi:MAG: hypothetical protein Kow0069_19880 [Promethearchaeota archaeon]